MIQHEINHADITVKHFNHPDTFKAANYRFFDGISAWVIFLSEDHDSDFLDAFLNRYMEKPTLFLFEKSTRKKTAQKIQEFITDNKLLSD